MAHLGMIAGAGELPEIIARRAYAEGTPLPTVALSTHVAAQLTPYCPTLVHYGPGQLTKIIRVSTCVSCEGSAGCATTEM